MLLPATGIKDQTSGQHTVELSEKWYQGQGLKGPGDGERRRHGETWASGGKQKEVLLCTLSYYQPRRL